MQKVVLTPKKPWQSTVVQALIAERKNARTSTERSRVSKSIQKATRKELRRWHSDEAKEILEEFKDLDRMNAVLKTPFTRSTIDEQPDPNTFAKLLREVYASDLPPFFSMQPSFIKYTSSPF